jgi:hypothetical protein
MPDTLKQDVELALFAKSSADPFAQLLQALCDATPVCAMCGRKQQPAKKGCEMCSRSKAKRSNDVT